MNEQIESIAPPIPAEAVARLVCSGMLAERGDMHQAGILFCHGLGIRPNEDNIRFACDCLEISKAKLNAQTPQRAEYLWKLR